MSREKLVTVEKLAAVREELARRGGKLVFTNGCFDLLHVGHVRYLQQARRIGDALAVAVNDDDSVRALKGEGRPVTPASERAEVLAALECVDYVTIFADARVTNVLRQVRPHIYAKGGDYSAETLNAEEGRALKDAGSDIRILPLVPGRSTTAILKAWSG